MILSRIIFPPEQETEKTPLYFRGQANYVPDRGLILPAETEVRFDTYFNAFFYGTWLRCTCVDQVCAVLITSGTLELTLWALNQKDQETVLFRREVSGEYEKTVFPVCELAGLPGDGALFLTCRTKSTSASIHQGWFETVQVQPATVKTAAVICTYRREKLVQENLRRMAGFMEPESPIYGMLDVLVIDNGNSLRCPTMPGVTVFPNKNWGGSGGFARGMLEAGRIGGYTHVLLMDDDISFEPETLLRTIQFLRTARQAERPVCIGGQMLLEHQPAIQFESGARYLNGRLRPNGRGLDLSERRTLLKNAKGVPVQYNAWWYCCIPVSAIEKYGFPMPFFIKTDDVEYGLRLKAQVAVLNGIGVWHMAFSEKYSPHLEYYIKRNELVTSAIHGSGAGVWPSLYKLCRSAGKAFLKRDGYRLRFMLRACEDFLAGPDFFLETDAETLNRRLLEEIECGSKGCCHSIPALFRTLTQFALHYGEVRTAYQRRQPELVSEQFWQMRLGLV